MRIFMGMINSLFIYLTSFLCKVFVFRDPSLLFEKKKTPLRIFCYETSSLGASYDRGIYQVFWIYDTYSYNLAGML